MITLVIINSWKSYKSQDQSLIEKRPTFKLHICTRWKIVSLKWLLKLLLQGGTSNFSILLFFFLPIKDLCDEIIKFCENCHNRNCLWSVTMKRLEILSLPFPAHCSLKNLSSNSNNGRDAFRAKQNLNAFLVVSAPCQGWIKQTILHGFGPLC